MGNKCQLEVADDFVHHVIVRQESDDLHLLAHPLSLGLGLGSDPAVDIEPRVSPGENPLHPSGVEKLLADKIGKNLTGKDLSQPRVVDARDPMEEARLVHSALGHQEMETGVKIDPVPKGLDGGNDSRH